MSISFLFYVWVSAKCLCFLLLSAYHLTKYVNNFKIILWYCWVEQSINVSHVKLSDLRLLKRSPWLMIFCQLFIGGC